MGLENYECDNQMNITEWLQELDAKIPQKCCGVEPWLHVSKCCRWHDDSPQNYMMHYICPVCFKVATDGTEWIDYAHGTYDKAKEEATKKWNNPRATKIDDYYLKYGINIHTHEMERFKKQYGFETDKCWLTIKQGMIKGK